MLARDTRLWFFRLLMRTRPGFLGAALKRLLRVRRRGIDTLEGRFWIDPASFLGYDLLSTGKYEEYMCQTLRAILQPGHMFVDVGANEGYFCVLASRLVGDSGKVLAVEPQERLRSVIEENFRLNKVTGAVVDSHAISDKIQIGRFHLSPDINSGTSGLRRATRYRVPTQNVEIWTLTELLNRHEIEHVDLMKMDIEGFEYEAILGSQEVFAQRRIRHLALELHPWAMKPRGLESERITEFLERQGYRADKRLSNLVYTC